MPITVSCRECAKPFSTFLSETKRGGGIFCSRKCCQVNPCGTPIVRFMKKLVKQPGGCWLWKGATHQWGYGRMQFRGRVEEAHRIAWVLFKGEIPEGMHVCHNCPGGDNPACCNPDHLFIGINTDNRRDSVRKGTHARDTKFARTKVPAARIQEIKDRYAKGDISQKALGKEFGVGQPTMWRILHDKRSKTPV